VCLSRDADAVFVGDVVGITAGSADVSESAVQMRVVRAGKDRSRSASW
jgi:hypothetical protein